MELIVRNRIISAPMLSIIERLKYECDYDYFHDMSDKGDYISVTCPIHKEGHELHSSSSIYAKRNSKDVQYGLFHCFTCGATLTLPQLVGYCFRRDEEFGEKWLIERFSGTYIEKSISLTPIEIDKPLSQKFILDESTLDQYNQYHPYMFKRKLGIEVIRKFKIGSTMDGRYLTFPCWDEKGNLIGVFKRSTTTKEFIIPKNTDKPVYLLNFLIKENITTAYVAEAQINALTLETFGYRACALFGTGSKEQYKLLKKSGIRNFILCLDGDKAGWRGIDRFINNMPSDRFITIVELPLGKDVNDLTKQEFDNLPRLDKYEWKKKYKNKF